MKGIGQKEREEDSKEFVVAKTQPVPSKDTVPVMFSWQETMMPRSLGSWNSPFLLKRSNALISSINAG